MECIILHTVTFMEMEWKKTRKKHLNCFNVHLTWGIQMHYLTSVFAI